MISPQKSCSYKKNECISRVQHLGLNFLSQNCNAYNTICVLETSAVSCEVSCFLKKAIFSLKKAFCFLRKNKDLKFQLEKK